MTEVEITSVQFEQLTTHLYDINVYLGQLTFLVHAGALLACLILGGLMWRLFVLAKNQSKLFILPIACLIPNIANAQTYDITTINYFWVTGVSDYNSTFTANITGEATPAGTMNPPASFDITIYYDVPGGAASSSLFYDTLPASDQTAYDLACAAMTWVNSNPPNYSSGNPADGSTALNPMGTMWEAYMSGNWSAVASHYNGPDINDPYTAWAAAGCSSGGGMPTDTDGDGTPDDEDNDDDGDGLDDDEDPCPLDATNMCEEGTLDTDGDGVPDYLDDDDDGDGVPDDEDVCPLDAADECEDGMIDTDGDGIPDHIDSDDDGDGIPDEEDPCPLDPDPECNDGDQQTCETQGTAVDTADLKARWPNCDYDGDGCKNKDDPDPYDAEHDCEYEVDEDECKEVISEKLQDIQEAFEEWGINFTGLTNLDSGTYPTAHLVIPSWGQENIVDVQLTFDPSQLNQPWGALLSTIQTLLKTGLQILITIHVWYKILSHLRNY